MLLCFLVLKHSEFSGFGLEVHLVLPCLKRAHNIVSTTSLPMEALVLWTDF